MILIDGTGSRTVLFNSPGGSALQCDAGSPGGSTLLSGAGSPAGIVTQGEISCA